MVGVWAVPAFVIDPDQTDTTPIITSSTTADGEAAEPSRPAPTSPPQVPAVDELAGVPAGYPPSDRGVATAAVNWTASFLTIVRMGPTAYTDTTTTLLPERRAESGTEEVVVGYLALIDERGPSFARHVWIESSLQAGVIETTATNAASPDVRSRDGSVRALQEGDVKSLAIAILAELRNAKRARHTQPD